MQVSIVLATHNKPELLNNTMESIVRQSFTGEIIVVDDGSTPETKAVCDEFDLRYFRIERESEYRNPCFARNVGYKHARGDIVIAQSDDVVHNDGCIKRLCKLRQGEFHLATVYNAKISDSGIRCLSEYVSAMNPRPFFFLGSLWRKDLYAIGGNCESYVLPGFDDDFFAEQLTKGLGLEPVIRGDVIGYHQDHKRPRLRKPYQQMSRVFASRVAECEESGNWCAIGGPWEYVQGKSLFDLTNQ